MQFGNERIISSTIDTNSVFTFVCLMSFWTWFLALFFSYALILPTPPELHVEPLFRLVTLSTAAASFCVLLIFRRFVLSQSGSTVIAVMAPLCALPTCLLSSAVTTVSDITVALWLSWGLAGISLALLLLQTGFFLASLEMHKATFVVSLSLLVGSVMYLLVNSLSSPTSVVAVVMTPFLISACSIIAKPIPIISATENRSRSHIYLRYQPIRIIVTDFFCAFLFGLTINAAVSTATFVTNAPDMITAGSFLSGIILLVITVFKLRMLTDGDFHWMLIPLAIVCALPLPLFDETVRMICGALMALILLLFDSMNLLYLADNMRSEKKYALDVFCIARGIVYSGFAFGWGVSTAFLVFGSYNNWSLQAVVLSVAAALTVMLTLESRPSKVTSSVIVTLDNQNKATWRMRCQSICETASLTEKESEVFFLLSRGRNAQYISERLYISNHTAKAHIYHIYQKIGIHKQQDLINMVEQTSIDDAD
jgi:DNA-binding CsgD family transcriptional regulator